MLSKPVEQLNAALNRGGDVFWNFCTLKLKPNIQPKEGETGKDVFKRSTLISRFIYAQVVWQL